MRHTGFVRTTLLSTTFLLLVACFASARTDHKEYKNSKLNECQDCHSGAGDVTNHGGYREHRMLAERADTNCIDCHQQSFCLDCHSGGNIEAYKQKSLSRTGEAMPSTHGPDFVATHALQAKSPQTCYRCHDSSFCSDCHGKVKNKGSMSVKSHWAAGNTQKYFLNRNSSAAEIAVHAAEARRELQSCQGCHPDAVVCSQCHNLKAPGGKVFK
ncbi:cytochrome C [Geobacter sp. FeAm09]|uniref:cytochrome C n=1 Tax=Geobacter sp. FeAm09 TaxID=2597769 RepID=UPI0011ED30B8|nr:cytochrome C [Geobacter sp. FeAm09]QEM67646.1 cytochrome C [Geobacter sp. FeAm09]